ncbi:EAL domain-containing protein [Rhodobacterales bacterium HKCCE3408]|nr:EAL domain-containing protein [Rhodobacterales bacterium HKCCE3408]
MDIDTVMTTGLADPVAQRGGFIASDIEQTMHAAGHTAMMASGAASYCLIMHPPFLEALSSCLPEIPGPAGDRALAAEAMAALRAEPDPEGRITIDPPKDGILRRQLFDVGGRLIGAIALDLGPAARAPEKRLDWAIRSVELLLEAVYGKLALELDLVASNRRLNQVQRIAETDGLTGLTNAATFTEQATEILRSSREPMALIVVDIDHFKRINDLYGHQFGDRFLQVVARTLRSVVPEGALLGRIGGDEFAVLTHTRRGGQPFVESLMGRCLTAMQRTSAMMGKTQLGRISLGASLYPTHAADFRELFEQADASLYASKTSGRGTTTFYSEDQIVGMHSGQLVQRMETAMAKNRIRPYFQPIADLSTGLCHGFEALARWNDPERGLLPPEAFSAALVDHRLAEMLTRHLIPQALAKFSDAARSFRERGGAKLRLSINLTEFDFRNAEFVFDLQQAVADTEIDWSDLVIEVSENTMLDAQDGQVFRTLNELRIRGAHVALDDFGTGYGGLRHLSGWPVDVLKIDRHFVKSLADGPTERAITSAIIDIARRSNFTTVAEGIETLEQLATLRDLGCQFGQGYLFSDAVAPEEVEACALRYEVGSPEPPVCVD